LDKACRMEKRSGVLRLLAVLACVLCRHDQRAAGAQDVAGQAGQAAKGQLRVLGEHIETIILVDGDGQELRFSGADLAKPLELAPGTYRPQEIQLKGGYGCNISSEAEFEPVKVEAGQTAELKAGGPLTQGLTVERQGKMFRLGYELKGVGGEAYTMAGRMRPPEFAVFKGDRKVGGGQFEFG